MTRYIARFMKDVLGANGHEAEICQRSIEIEAPSRGHAVEMAKVKFCETEKVRDWLLHADRVRITDVEFPSSQSKEATNPIVGFSNSLCLPGAVLRPWTK